MCFQVLTWITSLNTDLLCLSGLYMVAAVKRHNSPHRMPAGRIPTATTHQMELVTAAIAPTDFRGTHTCQGLVVDAKVPNKLLYIYACSTCK